MKNKNLIIGLTAVVTLLCVYFLSFTLISGNVEQEAEMAASKSGKLDAVAKQKYLDSVWFKPVFLNYTYKDIKQKELQLGLDLQGGMHVVLEVSPVEIIKVLAGMKANDPSFKEILKRTAQAQKNSQKSFVELFYASFKEVNPNSKLNTLFLNSGTQGRISYDSNDDVVLKLLNESVNSAVDRSYQILRNRIDKLGVVQPNIQIIKGSNRIQVELPGIKDTERARNVLKSSAILEFYEVWHDQESAPFFNKLNDFLVAEDKSGTNNKLGLNAIGSDSSSAEVSDSSKSENSLANKLTGKSKNDTSKSAASDTSKAKGNKLGEYFVPLYTGLGSNLKDTAKVGNLMRREEVMAIFPSNMTFLWGTKAFEGKDGQSYLPLYAVKKGGADKAVLEGDAVKDAHLSSTPKGPGVSLTLKPEAARTWRKVTANAASQNPQRAIAIVLDNYVVSAPTVNEEIPNGQSIISGSFTVEEAKDLADILKIGRMPAPTRIVEEAIVGPNLGSQAISQGMISMVIALGLVMLFMMMYYNKGGMIANIALLFNVLFVVGIMVQLQSVLTLPGIAGIVLTVGMAVDANVLIFERIREELRAGNSIIKAVELGYEKAFSSIFDANVTTFLSGIILFVLGSGPIKGFAITLIIGIFCSFFTAVYISRVILEWMLSKKSAENISFDTPFSRNLFQNFNFDYISKRKMAYIFSTLFIAAGFASIFIQGGLNYGVDFAGGRSYIVEFKDDVNTSELKEKLNPNFGGKSVEIKTFGSENKVKVTTNFMIEDETDNGDNTVKNALISGLDNYKKGSYEVLSSSKVGPTIADDIKNTSVWSLGLALLGIFFYVLIRFSNKSFGIGGVLALLHDCLVVISAFALARWFGINYEVDQVFVAAVLTIAGYSINDTVVVFDRIREFVRENPDMEKGKVLNDSINHTMSRTIMTAFTVLLVVVILFAFGGEILKSFSFAMLVGVISGSYSTIFLAVPVVLDLTKSDDKLISEIVITPEIVE